MTTRATAHIVAKIRYLRDGERMGHIDNSLADSELMRMMAAEATNKLDDATKKGRHGWWDDKVCSIRDLKLRLGDAIFHGNMIDVINYAAMIHAREAVDGKDPMQLRVYGYPDENSTTMFAVAPIATPFNPTAECSPTATQCPRCNNPHNRCDKGL
jgi:hypothetical protein